MRNMGRLFQYNRFGSHDQAVADNRKGANGQSCVKNKEQFAANCPAYAELYPQAYACNNTSNETTATPTLGVTATALSPSSTTATTATATTMTSRSIDLALRKYQQWSSKFLPATSNNTMPVQAPVPAVDATNKQTATTTPIMPVVATNADCVTHLSTSSSHKSNSCSYSYSTNTTTATSGYYSRLTTMIGNVSDVERTREVAGEEEQQQCWAADGDRELLVSANKRPKVYDCMKEFLCRKLFQQRHGQQEQQERRQQQQQSALLEDSICKSDTEEDVTSDYDEVDMLDSSYNADEEDASDCSSQCTCPLESDNEDMDALQKFALIEQQPHREKQQQKQQQRSTPQKSISPQKSLLSLNCWQNSTQYTDSTTTTEAEEEEEANEQLAEKVADYQNIADDSDAGISDCCQLISEKSSPSLQRFRLQKQKQQSQARYNRNANSNSYTNTDEDGELLVSNWYQPRITTKAALERLQQATPGTFLLRRKSRSYELCLRAETKVKQFVVVALADNHYKLKGAKKQFTSLKALVTHHSVMAEELPLTLALPRAYGNNGNNRAYGVSGKCAQTWRSLRYADDFDTYESLQILGLLQDWQSESNEF